MSDASMSGSDARGRVSRVRALARLGDFIAWPTHRRRFQGRGLQGKAERGQPGGASTLRQLERLRADLLGGLGAAGSICARFIRARRRGVCATHLALCSVPLPERVSEQNRIATNSYI